MYERMCEDKAPFNATDEGTTLKGD